MEDWENLKELFSKAAELCERAHVSAHTETNPLLTKAHDADDEYAEALPLLRAVLRECHRMLTIYPDPSIIFMNAQNVRSSSPAEAVTPTDERLHRDWGQDTIDQAFRVNLPRTKRVRYVRGFPFSLGG